MIKTFNSLFVTMLGLGKVKIIPGTFGSLATILILFILFLVKGVSVVFLVNQLPYIA